MMKEVGAEQGSARLLEQYTRIPPVGKVWRTIETVAVFTGGQNVLGCHSAGRPDGEIIHTHQLTDERADRLGFRGKLQPIVERAAFVGLKVTPGNIAEFRRIYQ